MMKLMALDPVFPATTNLSDYRYRAQSGDLSLLPDSTARAPDTGSAGNQQKRFAPDKDDSEPAASTTTTRDGASDFAAAVIAGALPPTPQSMNELIRRIGSSEIPEESQARLKDLIA